MVVALIFCGLSLAIAPEVVIAQDAAAESPAVTWSRVRQTELPAYRARAEAAQARAEVAELYYRGDAPLAEAFPELADAPLGSLPWLSTRLSELDDRATARLEERLKPIPPLGSAKRAKLLESARAQALAAEDAADGLERRLLLVQRKFLTQHPELSDHGLAQTLARLRETLAKQEALWAAAPEADRPALAEGVARAQRDLQRLKTLRAQLLTVITVPGAEPLSPAADVALAHDPLTAPEALNRLALMRPLLGDAFQDDFEQAQRRWILGPDLDRAKAALAAAQARKAALSGPSEGPSPPELPLSELRSELAKAQEARKAAESALAALPEGGEGSLADARRQVATVELETAGILVEIATQQLADGEARVLAAAATSAEADRSKAQAEVAREAAVKATQEAEDSRQFWFAQLLRELATEQEKASALWAEAEDTRKDAETRLNLLQTQIADLRSRAAAVAPLGSLDPRRGAEFDAVFESGRQVVEDLRRMAAQLGSLQVQKKLATGEPAAGASGSAAEPQKIPKDLTEEERVALDELRKAREDQLRAEQTASTVARGLQDRSLALLAEAKELRREITPEVSDEVLQDERAYLIEDLIQEVRLITPNVIALVDSRFQAIVSLPKRLTDFNLVGAFLIGSVRLLVVLSIWLWARRRSDRLAQLVLTAIWRKSALFAERNIASLLGPLTRVVQAGIDLGAGWVLVGPVTERIPELGLLLLIYLQVALYRLLVAFFDLLVAEHPETRPNLFTLQPAPHKMLRRTVKYLFFWVISRQFVLYITLTILGADRISALLSNLFGIALLLLVFLLFHLWEPLLRQAVSYLDQSNRLVAFLSHPPQGTLLKAPRGLASAILLIVVGLINVGRGRVDEHSAVGRVVNLVNRYRMAEKDGEDTQVLPPPLPELIEAIRQKNCPEHCYIDRSQADEQIDAAITSWKEEGRRGMVALLGDQGEGKRTYLDNLVLRYETEGHHVVRTRLTHRLTTEAELLVWLAEVMGLPPEERTAAELSVALNELPPGICVLEDLHLAFMRTVDGFEAMRALLYVLNGANRKHFWIGSFHLPAWHYLSRLGQLVNMQTFRAAVRLTPMGEQALRKLITSRLETAGYEADYSGLVRRSPLGADPQAELERTISAFFRLLGQASGGNPEVALRMFAGCVSQVADKKVLKVRMGEILTDEPVGLLSDTELFTLTALRIQDRLSERELVQVTNMGTGVLRSVIRDLESRNIIYAIDGMMALEDSGVPAITRLLRRRHFLQGQ